MKNRKMRQIFAVLLAGAMIFGNAAAVLAEETSAEDTGTEAEEEQGDAASAEESQDTAEGGEDTAEETDSSDEETPEMLAMAKAEELLKEDWLHGAWVRVYREEGGRPVSSGDDVLLVMPDNTVYYKNDGAYDVDCILTVDGESVSVNWDETAESHSWSDEEKTQAEESISLEIADVQEENVKNMEDYGDSLYVVGDYYNEPGVDRMLVISSLDSESDPMNPTYTYQYYMKQKQGILESASRDYLQMLFSGSSWEMNGKVLEIGSEAVKDSLGEENSLYRSVSMDNGAYTGVMSFGSHSLITADLNFEWENAKSGHYWFAGTSGDKVTLVKADDADSQVVMTRAS